MRVVGLTLFLLLLSWAPSIHDAGGQIEREQSGASSAIGKMRISAQIDRDMSDTMMISVNGGSQILKY